MEWQLVAGVSTIAATVAAIISTVTSIWWRHMDKKTVKWVISDIRPVMLGDAAEYYFQTRLERPDALHVNLTQIGQADAYNPHATIGGFTVTPIKLNGKPLTDGLTARVSTGETLTLLLIPTKDTPLRPGEPVQLWEAASGWLELEWENPGQHGQGETKLRMECPTLWRVA
ncbi:hypothetical protein [Mobiluncus mulieris]|uniref:Uncharacterized protein n=2 Tax=Mobiluncus mulieris TaxID=2052 RepID=E0QR88_9ACTO|nr:hypothetical protein [Mobiluncus mulieris]EFM46081.1 hypothetical protein HMPREF0580_1403 [Mobiluncus mulieris ATCC 35239]MCU9973600.1 alanine racemase [Mobiluncus mulieris]MCU9993436.1 alanine racemase [Mobiluncus mulieris]MCV0009240.1 alanine racemase [Mobiluncus mulieris]NMW64626.1 alanine racemase [Mobiluncus mulieris]